MFLGSYDKLLTKRNVVCTYLRRVDSTYCGLIAIECLSLVFLVYNRFFYLVPVLNKEKELKLINAIKFSANVQQLKRVH